MPKSPTGATEAKPITFNPPPKAGLASKELQNSKYHHDFMFKEMIWMSEDFDRESKKKKIDSKKSARLIRKAL